MSTSPRQSLPLAVCYSSDTILGTSPCQAPDPMPYLFVRAYLPSQFSDPAVAPPPEPPCRTKAVTAPAIARPSSSSQFPHCAHISFFEEIPQCLPHLVPPISFFLRYENEVPSPTHSIFYHF
ncbi:hypothetical protein I3842_01G207900 [Carya illinoinensis]|uniref:Uncharacterized protein n=1 Tax=Carya illinoinensis TaxID=32201 RepID=A0A922K6Y4_CARIL|nr:hypothetical protein I3842_01G207900 [Carya illinoinensis]